ncbi:MULTISPECIES: helix-turn-helix transcriptional regulator [Cedecea]|uniref:Toxin-antitoxin system, antitoxin component, Xre domain protein n=1 Tax=Cedecea davisae DSM 4568 TaxID=566551 RepID=S3JKF9_9ENTR|nr:MULTISPECIES: helix-turn-helix transcriptional regulator [Cedecea]EPF13749.1 toxin-antitoxin system, antitoxin component, Xre domain protein [Cedecea davisae DSM 4568]QIX96387.1 helix-turn-helix transcriptional regulator [Cedecea sp. FDAARGOS_727]
MKEFSKTLTDSALAGMLFTRIEARRKTMKITQLMLAERIGITPKTYRSLKTGSCNLLIFIAVLRELQLLDNFNHLIPSPTIRPAEVWSQVSPTGKKAASTSAQMIKIRSMMERRKKLKTGE